MKHTLFLLLFATAPVGAATLAGLWEFNNSGNLAQATVGTDLSFSGSAPGSWSATLADDASNALTGVITTPAGAQANIISATHGIAPNGGGIYVNQYSILVDIHSPASSRNTWRAIYQTNTTNSNDGDYWIRDNDDLLGNSVLGYTPTAIDETVWSRLVVTFDLGANDVRTYLNGSLVYAHGVGGLDGRFSLDPQVLFFADENGENAPMNVGAIAIWDGVLTAGDVSALGAAGAAIPEPGTASLLVGVFVLLLGARRRRH